MSKRIHFISGLPRSGSTLLCNILNQNPDFSVTGTSGILGVLVQMRNTWNQSNELLASASEDQKRKTMQGALQGYFSEYDTEVCFDKSRGWTGYMELAEAIEGNVKIIATVRDLTDILASFEKLFRNQAGLGVFPQEKAFPVDWTTLEGRLKVMIRPDQPVGSAYNRLKDAFQRGYGDKILIVEFDDLTRDTEAVIRNIYDFIGRPYYKKHDYSNVEQTIFENDLFHGMGNDLHKIRPEVKPVISDARKVLGDQLYKQFSNQEFWR